MKLRAQLAKIDEPRAGQTSVRIPGDFHSAPTSLRAMMRAMNNPRPASWIKASEKEHENKDWTEECQGVTHDGTNWFISSNRDPAIGAAKRGIYKFSMGMSKLAFFRTDFTGHDHIGDIDYYQGRIYAAMEQPPGIFWVDPAFGSHGRDTLKGATPGTDTPQGRSFAWCAINPWNGYLYSSVFGDADKPGITKIFAYDPADGFRHKSTLTLKASSKRIQGGCFSNNGHLLLASDHTHDIRCFSVLNGKYLGSAGIQVGDTEEVEGICIQKGVTMHGKAAQVHVILLDNDWPSADDVYFKHYAVGTPEDL